MSARIVVTLIMEYAGDDTAEYDGAMKDAWLCAVEVGDEIESLHESVRVVDVQVSG